MFYWSFLCFIGRFNVLLVVLKFYWSFLCFIGRFHVLLVVLAFLLVVFSAGFFRNYLGGGGVGWRAEGDWGRANRHIGWRFDPVERASECRDVQSAIGKAGSD